MVIFWLKENHISAHTPDLEACMPYPSLGSRDEIFCVDFAVHSSKQVQMTLS